MRFKTDRAALLRALTHVQSVVEKRNTLPILANALISTLDGRLTLAATDMEISVSEEVPAVIEETGATTAPAGMLYEIVKKLPEGTEIEFSVDKKDGRLMVTAGKFKTGLVVLPGEDFPALSPGNLPIRFALAAQSLRTLIDKTRFAVSTEETRYYLNGIFFHAPEHEGKKVLHAVATDGHRLARVREELPEGAAEMPGIIVPRKAVGELRKLLDETTAPVKISLSETRIQFIVGEVALVSKLIDGSFPDYERVIPKNNTKILQAAKKPFADAVGRVAIISTERSRPVKLEISPDKFVLSATSPEQGTATEELDTAFFTYTDEPVEIGFQARYLTDITDQVTENVEFLLADASAPTIIRDRDDDSALYVLMPMRV